MKAILFVFILCISIISYASEKSVDDAFHRMFFKEALPYLIIRSLSSYKDDPLYHQYTWKTQANKTCVGFLKFEYYPKQPEVKQSKI